MASNDLARRLLALEAASRRSGSHMTPGQDAAFNALRTYSKGERITWERFAADFPEISTDDKRDPYEGVWSLSGKHPHLTESFPATLDCPPWAVSQLESKVVPNA